MERLRGEKLAATAVWISRAMPTSCHPGQGAFAGWLTASRTPLHMETILARWGWHLQVVGKGIHRQMQWLPMKLRLGRWS